MKIGMLQFKEYAAKKPVALSVKGELLGPREAMSAPSLAVGSLHTLGTDDQLKLALARYKMEPDFKLAIVGVGILTKGEVIEHLKAQTDFGQEALQAEMQSCNELLALLAVAKLPSWPTLPKPPVHKWPDWKPPVKRCFSLKLRNQALFCECTTDPVTTPFANYRMANVHPQFNNRGFNIVVLQSSDDVRAKFAPEAKKALTTYISGIGHGNYTLYTGHAGDRILQVGQYDAAEVKNRAIHFLSCQTARDLGPDTVSKGAKCYAGYIENFILQWDDPSTPAVDEFTLFARCDSTFDIMMANGTTAQQAYDATIQAFNAAISQVPNTVAATYLTWDRDRLKLHGDSNTRIQPYRYLRICFPLTVRHEEALVNAGVLQD